ncbi:MAG: bifunctional riboflavin kinase/FAD synthetase [Bacillota bacterium]|jgi:riboflavin kinase/FMN adenylyltransferase
MSDTSGRLIAIGNFDGLHLGHRALLEKLHKKSRQLKLPATVLTFDPHPLHFFSDKGPDLLLTKEQKEKMLYQFFQVDEVIFQKFDAAFAALSPQEFVDDILIKKYHSRHVMVGFNFNFGKNIVGDAYLLRTLAAAHGVDISIVPPVVGKFGLVSSSSIREKIKQGQLDAANSMLGYCYYVAGKIVTGQKIGRTLNFPTANIIPPRRSPLPSYGVYAVRAVLGDHTYDGIANLGFRPTVGEKMELLLETHLLVDKKIGTDELYDQEMTVYFCRYLRPEKRFMNLLQLRDQLEKDKKVAQDFFADYPAQKHLPKRIK